MTYRTCINNKLGSVNNIADKTSISFYDFLINIHIYNLKLVDELLGYILNFTKINKNNYTIIPTIVVDSNFDSESNIQQINYNKEEFYDKIKSNIACNNDLVMKHLDKIYNLTKKS